jgi:uncharacterized protein (TIGR00661 family)
MARILYGIAGEGLGHCTRADLIGQRLLEAGNEVIFVGFGKAVPYLEERFGSRTRPIQGLGFCYKDDRIDQWRTFWAGLRRFPSIAKHNKQVLDLIAGQWTPDLVLSDFEPFSAWWARFKGLPVVSIDNEHVLTHCRVPMPPAGLLDRVIAKAIVRVYAFKADVYLILSFFDAAVTHPSAILAPPVVRPWLRNIEPKDGGYILLYISTGQHKEGCLEVLKRFERQRFVIYGFDEDATYGHCTLKRRSVEGFMADLASCSGVISSAGFSLITECLALGKPMLVLPVSGQYEQLLNAVQVQRLGIGIWSRQLSATAVERFLSYMAQPRHISRQVRLPDNEAFFVLLHQAASQVGVQIRC